MIHAYKPDGTTHCSIRGGKGKTVTEVMYRDLCKVCLRAVQVMCVMKRRGL